MDLTMELAYVFELCVWCWLQNYVASSTTIELGVVITLFKLRCMLNYLWTCCNMWHVCWIMYGLGCMLGMFRDPSWYSTNYRVYIGSSVCVSTCKRGQSCLILYKLVGSMIVMMMKQASKSWRCCWGQTRLVSASCLVSMLKSHRSNPMSHHAQWSGYLDEWRTLRSAKLK
jgi:hypothetical protein